MYIDSRRGRDIIDTGYGFQICTAAVASLVRRCVTDDFCKQTVHEQY